MVVKCVKTVHTSAALDKKVIVITAQGKSVCKRIHGADLPQTNARGVTARRIQATNVVVLPGRRADEYLEFSTDWLLVVPGGICGMGGGVVGCVDGGEFIHWASSSGGWCKYPRRGVTVIATFRFCGGGL